MFIIIVIILHNIQYIYILARNGRCCFDYFDRNSLVAFLQALFARVIAVFTHWCSIHDWDGGQRGYLSSLIVSWAANTPLKGVPEPLENKINQILGLKREDQFSDPFSDLTQNTCSVCFLYLLHLNNVFKAPQDMRKFLQKCQKIARCWDSAFNGARPHHLKTWLISSGTTRSRQYHKWTMVWRNLPLYHLFKCLLALCHARFVRKDKSKPEY